MFRYMVESLIAATVILEMPDWSGTGVNNKVNVALEFRGAGGDKSSVNLSGLNNAYGSGSVAALRTAVASLSNSVPVGTNYSQSVKVQDGIDAPLDESYSDVDTKLVLNFQDALLVIRQVAIPAPDEQFFGTDGIAAVAPDAAAAAGSAPKLLATAIAAIMTAINTGGGSFVYQGGYRVKRSRSLPRPRNVVSSVEPDGQNPGDAPGDPIP